MFKSNHTNNLTTTGTPETTMHNYTANYTANTTEATTTDKTYDTKAMSEPTTLEQCHRVDSNVPQETCRAGEQCLVSNIYLRVFGTVVKDIN